MHVLFLPSWYPNDPQDIRGSFFREQARALLASGCRVGVIAPSLGSLRKPIAALKRARTVRSETDQGVPTYRAAAPNLTPRIWSASAQRVVKLTRQLFDAYVAEEGQPDLIHVHSALPAGAAALDIKQRTGIPYLLSEHSSALARGELNASAIALMQDVARGAAARFAVSQPFAVQLDAALSAPGDARFAVMPNLIDDAFLTHPLSQGASNDFRFLHISQLDENKNVSLLLHAFARRFRDRAGVTLTIAGNGPTRSQLVTLSSSLGIRSQVSFAGKLSRSDVRAALSNSDAFVLPSRFETFGVVLIEALAVGVPVIATRCGGPEDIVTNDNGILVPVDDVAALAAAMETLHRSPARYPPQVLRADCRARFGAEALSREWMQIYANVLANEGPGR